MGCDRSEEVCVCVSECEGGGECEEWGSKGTNRSEGPGLLTVYQLLQSTGHTYLPQTNITTSEPATLTSIIYLLLLLLPLPFLPTLVSVIEEAAYKQSQQQNISSQNLRNFPE